MTSNIGGSLLLENPDDPENRNRIMELMNRHFRPEFLNRVDEILFFHSLAMEHLREIVDIQVADLAARLAAAGLSLEVSDAAKDHLAEIGFDPVHGARPLKRAITKKLETPISRMLVAGELEKGDTAEVAFENGALAVAKT
jgi:ATP-dependent Clp protease ATP-binding subunit ClpB